MKLINLYILYISILTFISCKQENKKAIVEEIKTVRIDSLTSAKNNADNTTQSTNELAEKKELNDCQKHWKLIDSLQKTKYTCFKENKFNKSISKNDLPEANKTLA